MVSCEQLEFSLNDADVVKLRDINDEGLVCSVICQVKFIAAAVDVSYFKDGKNRVDRMRKITICQNNNLITWSIFMYFSLGSIPI